MATATSCWPPCPRALGRWHAVRPVHRHLPRPCVVFDVSTRVFASPASASLLLSPCLCHTNPFIPHLSWCFYLSFRVRVCFCPSSAAAHGAFGMCVRVWPGAWTTTCTSGSAQARRRTRLASPPSRPSSLISTLATSRCSTARWRGTSRCVRAAAPHHPAFFFVLSPGGRHPVPACCALCNAGV